MLGGDDISTNIKSSKDIVDGRESFGEKPKRRRKQVTWSMAPIEYGCHYYTESGDMMKMKLKGYDILPSTTQVTSLSFPGEHIPGSKHLDKFIYSHSNDMMREISNWILNVPHVCTDNEILDKLNHDSEPYSCNWINLKLRYKNNKGKFTTELLVLEKMPMFRRLLETNKHIGSLSISILYPNTKVGPLVVDGNEGMMSFYNLHIPCGDNGIMFGVPKDDGRDKDDPSSFDVLEGYSYIPSKCFPNKSVLKDASFPHMIWNNTNEVQLIIVSHLQDF